MDLNNVRLFLQKLGLKIENWLIFSNYLSIFSFERLLKDYCILFLDEKTNRFYLETTDKDIISLINFDKKIGTIILKWILFFESKFKKIIIEKWIDFYDIKNPYIYNFKQKELEKLLPEFSNIKDISFDDFIESLFEHAQNSEFIPNDVDYSKTSIYELSYSWSLATTINFFRGFDNDLKKDILKEFNIPYEYSSIFDKVLLVILKVRNTISHNHIIYNLNTSFYRIEFNKVYKSLSRENIKVGKPISLNRVIFLVDYLLNWNQCKKECEIELKELKMHSKAKETLIKILFGIE